jgi:hypothetical protein
MITYEIYHDVKSPKQFVVYKRKDDKIKPCAAFDTYPAALYWVQLREDSDLQVCE